MIKHDIYDKTKIYFIIIIFFYKILYNYKLSSVKGVSKLNKHKLQRKWRKMK